MKTKGVERIINYCETFIFRYLYSNRHLIFKKKNIFKAELLQHKNKKRHRTKTLILILFQQLYAWDSFDASFILQKIEPFSSMPDN